MLYSTVLAAYRLSVCVRQRPIVEPPRERRMAAGELLRRPGRPGGAAPLRQLHHRHCLSRAERNWPWPRSGGAQVGETAWHGTDTISPSTAPADGSRPLGRDTTCTTRRPNYAADRSSRQTTVFWRNDSIKLVMVWIIDSDNVNVSVTIHDDQSYILHRLVISEWHKVRYGHRHIFTYRRVKRHTFSKINVGHLMSREAHFHSVHLCSEQMLKMPTLFSAAQLGQASSVACHPPQMVLRAKSSTTSFNWLRVWGLRRTTSSWAWELGPEAEIETRQVGAVRRPLMFSLINTGLHCHDLPQGSTLVTAVQLQLDVPRFQLLVPSSRWSRSS